MNENTPENSGSKTTENKLESLHIEPASNGFILTINRENSLEKVLCISARLLMLQMRKVLKHKRRTEQ